jgi:nucleoside phosphorylase
LFFASLLSHADAMGEQKLFIMLPTDRCVDEITRRFARVGSPFKRQEFQFSRIAGPFGAGLVCRTSSGLSDSASLCAAGLRESAATHFISLGVAGALSTNLAPGDLVVVSNVQRHDGIDGGAQHIEHDLFMSNLLARIASAAVSNGITLHRGALVSGDSFIADTVERARLADAFAADIVDMTGSALVETCARAGIPVCLLRIVSDRADESAPSDFREFLRSGDALDRSLEVVISALQQAEGPSP